MFRQAVVTVGAVAALSLAPLARAALTDPIPAKIPDSGIKVNLTQIDTASGGGVTSPIYLTSAPNDASRLFVVDQTGTVKIVQNGKTLATPFLDVKSQINPLIPQYDERGLLGIAFDPNFATNGKVYTYYTQSPGTATPHYTDPFLNGASADHQGVLSQWTVNPNNANQIDPNSRKELLRWDHPNLNHNGGQLAFGPDGMLYMSVGDGGGADDQEGQLQADGTPTKGKAPEGNAQRTDLIMGKILRIDPNGTNSGNGKYGIPADNPFAGQAGKAPEIYAYGLRNPYRFSFDKANGKLIVADVGQQSIEEVDVVNKGANYGWHLKEGTFTFDPLDTTQEGVVTANSPGSPANLTDPVLQYDHDEGEAEIGGFVYHGNKIPALQGKYIWGDFGKELDENIPSGELWVGDLKTGKISRLGTNLGNPFNFYLKGIGEDANGELYVMGSNQLGPSGTGMVFSVDASNTNGGGGGTAIPLPPAVYAGAVGLALLPLARRRIKTC